MPMQNPADQFRSELKSVLDEFHFGWRTGEQYAQLSTAPITLNRWVDGTTRKPQEKSFRNFLDSASFPAEVCSRLKVLYYAMVDENLDDSYLIETETFLKKTYSNDLIGYIRHFLLSEREYLLSYLVPGSSTLIFEDVVAEEGVFISPPWGIYTSDNDNNFSALDNSLGLELAVTIRKKINTLGRVLILGEPGQGKTTILKRIFVSLIDDFLKDSQQLIPIYIPLRDFDDHSHVPDSGSLNWLWIYLCKRQNFPLTFKDFEYLVKSNRVVLLLDGLDEVKGELTPEIMSHRASSEIFFLQVILTCRIQFFETYLSTSALSRHYSTKLELLLWKKIWVKYVYMYCKKQNYASPTDVIQAIKSNTFLSNLAERPLLLVMILDIRADLYINENWNIAKLYDRYTRKWLKNEASKPDAKLSWRDKEIIIMELAWQIFYRQPSQYYSSDNLYEVVVFNYNELRQHLYPLY